MKYYVEQSCIIYKEKVYDFHDIKSNVNEIKKRICANVKNKDSPIAIMTGRRPELVFSMLALLELGIPFLNVDLKFPESKIKFMLETADIKNAIIMNTDEVKISGITPIVLNEEFIDNYSCTDIDIEKSELAYYMFTSGTTGNPKGVQIRRKGLNNFINGVTKVIDFKAASGIVSATAFCFDIFLLETILALSKGLKVYLATEEERKNPNLLMKLLKMEDVEYFQATPSLFNILKMYDAGLDCLKNMKNIMVGGECFPKSLLLLLQENTHAKIYNMYGPTETTIWSMIADLTTEKVINIGKPVLNTQIYLLNTDNKICKNGEIGEICIAGKGVAKGYCKNEKLTSEKFILHDGIKMYRTGDMARYDKSGRLICLGRNDFQIKLKGHRIELDEIDEAVQLFPLIQNSVTCITSGERKEIIVFYQAQEEIKEQDIMCFLAKRLPDYMLPNKLIRLEKLLYTQSGKADRNGMLVIYESKYRKTVKMVSDGTYDSDNFRGGIIEILQKNIDGIQKNLNIPLSFLGCDSLKFLETVIAIEKEYDIKLDDELILNGNSITADELIEQAGKLLKIKNM